MSNSIAPGSSAAVNVNVTALTTNPNVPVTYKTIILKKNLVNGVNTLTQEMMSATNTKYIIKYDYVLGEDITVPANCVLGFDGGSLSNGTIVGQNTLIDNGTFGTDVTFSGTFVPSESVFNNVAGMVGSENHVLGQKIRTLGFYAANDGGGANYRVRAKVPTDTEDGNFTIFLANDLVAEIIDDEKYYNVKKYGVKYDDESYLTTNATTILGIIKYKIGSYWTPKALFFPHGRVWVGNVQLGFTTIIPSSVQNVTPFCSIIGEGCGANRDTYAPTTILTKGSFITWEGYGCIDVKDVWITNNNVYLSTADRITNSVCFGVPVSSTVNTGEQNVILRNVRINGFHYGFRANADSSSTIIKHTTFTWCVYGAQFGKSCNRLIVDDLMISGCAFGLCNVKGLNTVLNNLHLAVACRDFYADLAEADGYGKIAGVYGMGLVINNLYIEDYGGNDASACSKYAVLWLEYYRNKGPFDRNFIDDFQVSFRDTGAKPFKFLRFIGNMRFYAYFTNCRNMLSYDTTNGNVLRRSAFEFYDDSGEENSLEDAGVWRDGLVFSQDRNVSRLRTAILQKDFTPIVLLKDQRASAFSFIAGSIVQGMANNGEMTINWTSSDYANDQSYYTLGGISALTPPTNNFPYPVIYAGGISGAPKEIRTRYNVFFNIYTEEAITPSDYVGKYIRYQDGVNNVAMYIAEDDIVNGIINKKVELNVSGESIYLKVPTTFTNTLLSKIKIKVRACPERNITLICGGTVID